MPTFDLDELIINTQPGHNKFWRGQRIGQIAYITYGPIGAAKPTRTSKPFRSTSDADRYIRKTSVAKRKKGYVLVFAPQKDDHFKYPDYSPVLELEARTLGSTPQSSTTGTVTYGTSARGIDLE